MKRLGCLILTVWITLAVLIPPVHAEQAAYKGKSYLLMEASTGTVLESYNEHEKLAPASVTKVMTLLLIMEAIDSGLLNWQDMVTASDTAAAKGGSQVFLKVGETMSVEDMVKSIAVSSANDCACAMAEHLAGSESAFVEKMNQRAQELGMEDTNFVNCTGLDDGPDAASHRTSAHDIALMSRELLSKHPDIKKYTTIWMDSVRNGTFGLSNTNKLIRFYNGATGLKTGFTSGAGFCLSASALRDGMELIAVVMGCETSADRFATCRQLMDQGFATYAVYDAPMPQDTYVPVKLGKDQQVHLVPGGITNLLVQKGEISKLESAVTVMPQTSAPVSKGTPLGELCIKSGDEILLRVPLVAEDTVERKGFSDLFLELLGMVAMARP